VTLIKISGYTEEKEEPGVRGGLLPALFEGQIKNGVFNLRKYYR
jgi:hypothetical protein